MPVRIEQEWLEELRRSLPELPTARAERFQKELGLPAYDAGRFGKSGDWRMRELLGLSPLEREAALYGAPVAK